MSTRTFLVRNAGTRQLVGVFTARRSNDLFSLIDERADPFVCEYLELVSGEGLFLGDVTTQASEALAARGRAAVWQPLDLAGFTTSGQPTVSSDRTSQPGSHAH